MNRLPIRFLVGGEVRGMLQRLSRPLSLWGGYDIATGAIIDATHPERGRVLAGRVLAMTEARGSSSSSSSLVEAARSGTAPAAILLSRIDPILVIGSLVARDLYDISIPIAILDIEFWPDLVDQSIVQLSPDTSEIWIGMVQDA